MYLGSLSFFRHDMLRWQNCWPQNVARLALQLRAVMITAAAHHRSERLLFLERLAHETGSPVGAEAPRTLLGRKRSRVRGSHTL